VVDLGPWEPLKPQGIADTMIGCRADWWLAGGWAIDLLVGRQTRPHSDVDVLVLRDQQHLVREHLMTWDVHAADRPGSLRPWPLGETLPEAVHDIWCRRHPDSPWSLQLMIDNRVQDEWVFRRDNRIHRPVPELTGRASRDGLPVLSAEVLLLYKSGSPRRKDEDDFMTVIRFLTTAERGWLRGALKTVQADHPWRVYLAERG
jgi:hypothetical protein